jgi:rod shape-determining protein MreC
MSAGSRPANKGGKPDLQSLPQIKERISFLYVERCALNRQDHALTIADARSSVAGIIERTRDDGVLRGNLYLDEQDEALHMYYLPQEAEYRPGDRVITSGLDGIYPKGLLIGQIKGLSRDLSTERYAVVSPGVSFRHVEEVTVLLNARDDDLPDELMPSEFAQ